MHQPNNPQYGFTLLELMITIAIAAILLAIAIPSFQAITARAQITTQTNNVLTAIAAARTEAIKNNTRAVLCSSDNGTACTVTPWTNGSLVFVDADRDGILDAGETITRVNQAVDGLTIVGNANVANRITFGADGLLAGVNNGTVRVCKTTTALPANQNARDIVINTVGRVRVEAPNPAIPAGTCPAP